MFRLNSLFIPERINFMSNNLENHNNEIQRLSSEALEAMEALKENKKENKKRQIIKVILSCFAALVISGSVLGFFVINNSNHELHHCDLDMSDTNFNGRGSIPINNEYTIDVPSTTQGIYDRNGGADRLIFSGKEGDVIYITIQYPNIGQGRNYLEIYLTEPSGVMVGSSWGTRTYRPEILPTTLKCTGTHFVYVYGDTRVGEQITSYSVYIQKK